MQRPLALLLTTAALAPQLRAQLTEDDRIEMPGQVIVCFTTDDTSFDVATLVAAWDLQQGLQGIDASFRVDDARSLLQWQRRGETVITNVVLIDYSPPGLDHLVVREHLVGVPGFRWAAPNVGLTGDVKELIPNDPLYGSQYHHPLIQSDDAWDITLGDSSVIIGVTDDGVDLDHEDLAANIWINAGETPGDGIDNDSNGYVDDVNGFDFVFNNNDPNPNGTDDHGTHVAGIAAAKTDNGIGVAGVAGDATIMPLQFYSSGQPWLASTIAEAFGYGVDNGARILSTSYNMDGWVGDPTVMAAFDYIYDQGAIHFNSAGNGGALNPPRQAFHQSFLVVSTDSSDHKSSFSNYGDGVEVSAPGSSILSCVLNDAYGTKSGTSMAAPIAAGVAALIWSANPTWTRDQVGAQIYFTGDNIDALNPGFEDLLGRRVNPFRALTMTLPAPKLVSSDGLPDEGGAVAGELTSFELRFDQIMDPGTVNSPSGFSLLFAGADDSFGTGDDAPVAITWDEYLIGGNKITFTPTGSLPGSGFYRFTADGSVLANPFGTALDGNADGIPGDSWTRTFSACAVSVLLVDNAESGVDWSVVNQSLQTGAWTVPPEVPIGGGVRNDPPDDYDGSGKCFLTENAPGNTDVDGGPTRLISKAFDLTITPDPYMSYARWLVTSGDDVMNVHISNDNGGSWTLVESWAGASGWEVATFRVADHVVPSAQVRLRFSVADSGSPSITEAAIDYLRVLAVLCDDPNVGTQYCVGAPNSTGAGASIHATGSDVVAGNDFTLITENLPAGQFGLYYFGSNQIQIPFGDGFRCVGGFTVRIEPPLLSNGFGVAQLTLDLTASPAAGNIISGADLNFQFWYRDPGAGVSSFNLSNALNVDWQ